MSDILIKGMEMPDRCFACPMCDVDCCGISRGSYIEYREVEVDTAIDHRPDWCPLVPVPEHERQDGLYSKYFVIKTETGEIVQDCFVLRPQKDKAAVAALLLYAKETESPELSSDIREWVSTIIPASEEVSK